jgi:hypothetical protein
MMRARLLSFIAVAFACVAMVSASAGATTPFSINVQLFAAGPCDPNAGLFVSVGPFDPFTNVGLLIDYAGGQHEGAAGPAGVSGSFGVGFPNRGAFLIGGTTTFTAFLDEDLNLEPDPGSPIVTTTLTYCPPPLAAEECKKGGFENFPNLAFKNQGDCVSYVATGGSNPPAG